MADTPNEVLHDRSIAHSVWLERYKTGLSNRVLELLNKTEADLIDQIAARLARIDQRGYDLGKATTKRLQDLLADIREKQRDVFSDINGLTRSDLSELADYEAEFTARLVTEAAKPVVALEVALPAASQLNSIVTSRPFQGRLLKGWWDSLAADAAQRISDRITIGITEGQTTDQIVRRIIGTRAAGYSDGVMSITRANATTIVRTATAHVAQQAKNELYLANADIGFKEVWVSTLDTKTSSFCRATDGKVFEIGKGPMPPAHFNCRSIRAAYFGNSTYGKRASQFGQVPEDVNYEQWLSKQSVATQNEALGVTKATLFRKGDLSIQDMLNEVTRQPYTLAELKIRDAQAFKKAGLASN